MLLNPEILLALLSSRVYSSAESERSTKLFTHQRKTAGQVFILDIIIFFSISAIFLPSFLSLQILPLTPACLENTGFSNPETGSLIVMVLRTVTWIARLIEPHERQGRRVSGEVFESSSSCRPQFLQLTTAVSTDTSILFYGER